MSSSPRTLLSSVVILVSSLASACAMPLLDFSRAIESGSITPEEVRRRAPSYSGGELTCLLGAAAQAGSREMARDLLAVGAKPSATAWDIHPWDPQNPDDLVVGDCIRDPLRRAVRKNDEEMVQLLLDAHADADGRVTFGDKFVAGSQTALMDAASRGNLPIARMLIAHGADVDATANDGETALTCAARKGSETIVQLLLEHHAPVDARDKKGKTPLYHAADKDHAAIVRILLDAGADVSVKDEDGRTPLNVATKSAVVAMLQAAGGQATDTELIERNARRRVEEETRKEEEESRRWQEKIIREQAESDRQQKEAIAEYERTAPKPWAPWLPQPETQTGPVIRATPDPPGPSAPSPRRSASAPKAQAPSPRAVARPPEPTKAPPAPPAPKPPREQTETRDCAATVGPASLRIEDEWNGHSLGTAQAAMPGAKYLTNVCLVGSVDGKVRRYQYRCSSGKWVFVQRFWGAPDHASDCIGAQFTFGP